MPLLRLISRIPIRENALTATQFTVISAALPQHTQHSHKCMHNRIQPVPCVCVHMHRDHRWLQNGDLMRTPSPFCPAVEDASCSFSPSSQRTMQTSFISCVPFPVHQRMQGRSLRRPRGVQLMSGKGFGKPPSTPTPTPNPKNQFSKAAPPKSNADFIPRGPTLREEYEQKGYIEPALGRDAGVLPEIVANRMLRRILTFGGIPLIGLFSFFAAYFVLKYKYDITVIPVVVAYSTLGTIFFATVGISYGIFSTSWDYDVEGSALGWEQVAKNLTLAKDGLLNAKEREARDEEFFKLDEIAKASKKEEAKNERTSEDDQ